MVYKKLFIMTLPRSGSTLLGQQLGIHSDIFHLGETAYWEILNIETKRCSCGKINCNFLSQISKDINNKHLARPLIKVLQIIDNKYWPDKKVVDGHVLPKSHYKINEKSFDYWLARCPKALENIIKIYRKHTNEHVFIDNTKLYHIGEKLAKDSSWGIIVLFRDPRGIMCSYKAAGIHKKDFRKVEGVLPLCLNFLLSVKRIMNFKNVHLIKYEDYCTDFKAALTEICDFVGVKFESKMQKLFTSEQKIRGHVLKGNRLLQLKEIPAIQEDLRWKKELTVEELSCLYNNQKLVNLYSSFDYFLPGKDVKK